MSEQTTDSLPQNRAPVFRRSLVRTVVLTLMIISTIPAAILGIANYIQYRNSLENTINSQLNSLSSSYSLQINQLAALNQTIVNNLAQSNRITQDLKFLQNGASDPGYTQALIDTHSVLSAQSSLSGSSTDTGIVEISILNSDGIVIASSLPSRVGSTLTNDTYLKSLFKSQNTILTLNPGLLYPGELMLVSTQSIIPTGQTKPVTFISFSNSPTLTQVLKSPLSTYSSAHVYFVTSDHQIVSLRAEAAGNAAAVKVSNAEVSKLNGYIAQSGTGKLFTYTSFTAVNVYSFIKPFSSLKSTYVIEVPSSIVQTQLTNFLNFLLIVVAATLLISGLITFLGARQIALPLVQLTEKARQFAGGDFSQKAKVNRSDEIGMLANSFNFMVDQLSTLYQSLESKVADRTKQLQIASEIGQEAISATRASEILHKVVQAIVDRFDVPYASVYLLDPTRNTLVLTQDHSSYLEGLPQRGLQLPLDNTSLIGWVANNDQARISQDIAGESTRLSMAPHLPTTRSEIAVPIQIGERLIGVLNIQSDSPNAFDFETVPTFSALANQVATGLRNVELLETTQVSLQETAVLYEASREISETTKDEELNSKISDLFNQTTYASILFDLDGNNATISNIGDAMSTPADKSLIGVSIPLAAGKVKLETDGPQVITNFQILTDFSQITPYFGRRGCNSIGIIPVFEGKALLHFLVLGSRDEKPLTPERIRPYLSLAETIGVTFERIHLIEKLGQKENEFSTFNSVVQTSLENSDLFTLCSSLHEKINSSFGNELGFCVALNTAENEQVQVPYLKDQELINIEGYSYSTDLLSQIIHQPDNKYLSTADDAGLYLIDSPASQHSIRSWMGYPMVMGGKVIGAIIVFDPTRNGVFTLENYNVNALIASQVTLAISDYLMQKQLQEMRSLYIQENFMLDSLLTNIPDRISYKGKNNEFVKVSKSLANYLGFTDQNALVGKIDNYHYVVEDTENNVNVDSEVISTLTPILNKYETWKNRDGSTESIVSNKVPLLTNDGEVFGLLSISRNVTEQIKAEQLAKHRADQLTTASEIAKDSTAGSMDVQVTLARLVELIRSRFGFYHASIFLIDTLGKNAVLRESTGEAGAQLKSAGHKLAVGSTSIVGQTTAKGEPVVISDVTAEENYFANPLLPDTRSELAIPLKIGDKVIGALDVQSKSLDAFSQEDINILQVLSDQIAVAIQNADLYTHTNQSLSRYRLLHQITSGNVQTMAADDAVRNTIETLHQAMPDEKIIFFRIDENNVLTAQASAGYPTSDMTTRRIQIGQGVVGLVARDRHPMRVDDAQTNAMNRPLGFDSNSILAVPVVFADQLLGVINIESTTVALFDDADQEFVTTLADNTASIISNIRLLDQVRDQVSRQQKLFEITNKIRRSVDIETIMQTSVSEICSAMNIPRASIHISANTGEETDKEKGS
jgi:PAS domain S-box-containing protein